MRRFLLPSTYAGKWSGWLLLLFVMLVGAGRLALNVPVSGMLSFAIIIVAAGFGIFAMVRRGERSLLVLIAAILGTLAAIFTLTEILGPPH